MKRYNTARKWLIFWCLFIGVGAVGGAVGMFVAPDGSALGMQTMLPAFQVLPFAEYLFQDFVFPGIALLIVNGLTNLTAAVFLFAKKRVGIVLGGMFGITLMLWITIQFIIFPFNFMSTAYFIFGAAQAVTGFACLVFYNQAFFDFDEHTYKNIGSDPSVLVVYFSRLGRVKKVAYEAADQLGAELFEVKSTEKTEGTKGFWWCGRFGMHKWPMPIEGLPEKLEQYDKVVLCTPVWVFTLCSPMREFCRLGGGKIRRAEYICVHFQPTKYLGVFREMDELLGLKAEKTISIRCKRGAYRLMCESPAASEALR